MLFGAGLSEPVKCVCFISQLLSGFEVLMFYLYLSQYGSSLLKYLGKKKASQRVQKRKKRDTQARQLVPFQSPPKPLKMKSILFQVVHPACLMRALGVKRKRERWSESEGETEREICLICQKFFNLIYSCQDADDPDLITAFYLPDFTPGARHSSPTHTDHTHKHRVSG